VLRVDQFLAERQHLGLGAELVGRLVTVLVGYGFSDAHPGELHAHGGVLELQGFGRGHGLLLYGTHGVSLLLRRMIRRGV